MFFYYFFLNVGLRKDVQKIVKFSTLFTLLTSLPLFLIMKITTITVRSAAQCEEQEVFIPTQPIIV